MRIEEYLELVADAVSKRSKCRRQVGCVLADSKGRILSTGYNGLPAGGRNCTAETCTNPPGASDGYCEAIHAEINALIYCERPNDIYYAAITRKPCINCYNALRNTPTKVLIFPEL